MGMEQLAKDQWTAIKTTNYIKKNGNNSRPILDLVVMLPTVSNVEIDDQSDHIFLQLDAGLWEGQNTAITWRAWGE